MADIFVDNTATGAADGTTWADAFVTIAAATAVDVANDRIIVANTHSESTASALSFSLADNVQMISSTVSGTTTVTATKATSAQASITANQNLSINGASGTAGAYIFGMYLISGKEFFLNNVVTEYCTFWCGDGSSPSSAYIHSSTNSSTWESHNDTLHNASGNSNNSVVRCGNKKKVKLFNPTVTTVKSNHNAFNVVDNGHMVVVGGDVTDCDGSTLCTLSSGSEVTITKVKINVLTTTLLDSSAIRIGNKLVAEAVDDSNTIIRQERQNYEGSLLSDTGIVLDAENPATTKVSNKITTNAKAQEFFVPVRFPLLQGFADFSTAKTITIEFVQDGTTTALTDTEIWMELDYPDDTTSLYHVEDDKAANNLSGANQASSSASWTGLSGTNVKQKLSVTTTNTGKKGPYQVFINLAKTSTTVYVNPKADIS